MTDTRKFTHDCEYCTFHGHMQGHDVYTCRDSLILRWGSDGPEYQSLPMEMVRRVDGQMWRDAIDVVAASVREKAFLGESVLPKVRDLVAAC